MTRDELVEATLIAISRAFARRLRGDQQDLRERLEEIIEDLVPKGGPERAHDKGIVLARALAAVRHEGSNLVMRKVQSLCSCQPGEESCVRACPTGALTRDSDGRYIVDANGCLGCESCASVCPSGAIVQTSDCLSLVEMILDGASNPLYAIVAPSFVGQFGAARDSQVKEAIKRLGFAEVYETALAADILTLQEADEFVDRVERGEDFMITSCCCPAFVKLAERFASRIGDLVSDSVSPMIALGRLLKAAEPEAHVVFIGPCLAKKAESRTPGLSDAIDLVLTFKETAFLLKESGIEIETLVGGEPFGDASHDGRIYAHTGGVSEAITRAVHDRSPGLGVHALKGNGLKQCREILEAVERGEVDGNFMEGMACPGGCAGGPGTIIKVGETVPQLLGHADDAPWLTARENERAREMLDVWGGKVALRTRRQAAHAALALELDTG